MFFVIIPVEPTWHIILGPVLGPMWFLVFITDLVNATPLLDYILFAPLLDYIFFAPLLDYILFADDINVLAETQRFYIKSLQNMNNGSLSQTNWSYASQKLFQILFKLPTKLFMNQILAWVSPRVLFGLTTRFLSIEVGSKINSKAHISQFKKKIKFYS